MSMQWGWLYTSCSIPSIIIHGVIDEQQLIEQVMKLDRRPLVSELCSDTSASIAKLFELCRHKEMSQRTSSLCHNESALYVTTSHIFMSQRVSSLILFICAPRHVKHYFSSIGYKVSYDDEAMKWNLKRSMLDGIFIK